MIVERNFVDQPLKNNLRLYDTIQKIVKKMIT